MHRGPAEGGLGNLPVGAGTGYQHGGTANINAPMQVTVPLKYQWDRFIQNYSNISSWLLRLHVRTDGSSCYFSFFLFSQSNPVDLLPAHQLHLH